MIFVFLNHQSMFLSWILLKDSIFIISHNSKIEAWGEIKKYIYRDTVWDKKETSWGSLNILSNKGKGKQQIKALSEVKTKGGRSRQGETCLIQSL